MRHLRSNIAWRVAIVSGALLAVSAVPRSAPALPEKETDAFLAAARELLGVPYQFGGRMLRRGEGIDCLGVLFHAAEAIRDCGWRSYSVNPSHAVAHRELGDKVPGLAPVASGDLRLDRLERGDVLWLVGFGRNPAEAAIGTLSGVPVWVWHTGIYAGDGKWVVGDHIAGKVVEADLLKYLRDNMATYAGVLVTRMQSGPSPARCMEKATMSTRPRDRAPGHVTPAPP